MFKNILLGKKIAIGFGAVLVLMLVVAVVGYMSLGSSSAGFERYRHIARVTNTIGRVQANMLEMRLQSRNYIETGNKTARDNTKERYNVTEEFVAEAKGMINNKERKEAINKIDKDVQGYGDYFDEVVDLMAKRDGYVQVLNSAGPMVEKNLTSIMQTAERDGDAGAAYNAGMCLRSLLLTRLYMMKFLDTNGQAELDRTHQEIATLEDNFDILDKELNNSERRARLQEARKYALEYKENMESTATTIFERNDLVSSQLVVLGSEVGNQVEDIKISYKDEQDTLGPALQASNRNAVILICIVSVIALLVGIILAYFIARGIVLPIRKVTDIAEEISKGDLNAEIEIDQKDEIGQLANAFIRMTDSLRKKASAADEIGQGRIGVTVDVASEKDVLGKSMVSMVESLKDKSRVASRIADGDLNVNIKLASDADELGKAMITMVDSLQNVNKEVAGLTKASLEGKLDTRGDAARHRGDYGKMVGGINELLDAIIKPIQEAASVLQKAAGKDMTARVVGDYKGQLDDFKQDINATIDALDGALIQVNEAVEQVGSASNQIASGSQSLAEGTNEQASSIEEVSSSLEEMASMTKQNSDNAKQAKNLSNSARESADKGNGAMKRMSSAIDKIKESSDQTAKIVKTIDEIAFQTNLLALNAAVEAARAGEAGKGFAVVAEEVRNLAQRSAEAAKITAEMIEEAVVNANGGVSISQEVAGFLQEISEGAAKVNDLVSEITAAAEEQSQGIDQINIAVSQMDKVTQMNASNSEESASAAEELNGQAEELRRLVNEFKLTSRNVNRIVDSISSKPVNRIVSAPRAEKKVERRQPAVNRISGETEKVGKKANGSKNRGEDNVVNPDKIIPMADEDFSDF